ncbi:MAG TPA: toast rack family protein [Candidatus Saccharimonadales bacterium]|jgi:hypothetical protein|nr:toast rack family protein [Candidatus Saccharimonadales bacterium]
MANVTSSRRTSLVVPIVLITLGAMFLYANWRPAFDPWPILRTYWPLILVFIGLGKMWDATRGRQNPDGTARSGGVSLGATIGALAFVLVLVVLFWHGRAFTHDRRYSNEVQHNSRTVERQGAKSVNVSLDASSGEIDISGGSSHLLDADFNYSSSYETPRVDYNVAGGVGRLTISQDSGSAHFGAQHNQWNLRFSSEVPLELKVEMGAGRGQLRLRDMAVTRLEMSMGAGQADLDLTGDRKNDLVANLEGGVGQVTIRLPRKVGVMVQASGGIGAVDAHGLRHDNGEYTNDAYGKTPATIHLRVEGGVGQISLIEEP